MSFFAFYLIHLIPGDPVLVMLGERGVDPKIYLEMKQKMGIDLPLMTQYGLFLKNIFHGHLGTSLVSQRPVLEEFWDRFPATMELALMATLISSLLGPLLGTIAALKRGTFWDYTVMGFSLLGHSMPIFWWGLVLILTFSVKWGLTPVSGRIGPLYEVPRVTGILFLDTLGDKEAFWDCIRHLILPSFVLATIPLATLARMTRSSLLEVLQEDYLRTARAKGLGFYRILFVHAFRNALIPIVTVLGLSFSSLITGAILTETLFSWPGLGKWMIQSVQARDYPVIQGGILILSAMVILIQLGVELSYLFINPRLRK